MTIKELKEAISNLPDDGEVYVQRIEDHYFEENHWSVKKMEGEEYHRIIQFNADIDNGVWLDDNGMPNVKNKFTEDEIEASKEQYIDTWCCINYDGKNLYITSHY